jgi:hypothetical protein
MLVTCQVALSLGQHGTSFPMPAGYQLTTQDCPAGFAWSGNSCNGCFAGQFKAQGDTACAPCNPGRHQQRRAQSSCTFCKPGYAASQVLRLHDPDTGGIYNGIAKCVACRPGKWNAGGEGRSVHCRDCSQGTYGLGGSGTSDCSGKCDAGRFGTGGSASPYCDGECARGRYGVGGSTTPLCDGVCPTGRYGPGTDCATLRVLFEVS